MKPKNHIATELSNIAPVLSGLDRTPPYFVPIGYFDSLCEVIVGRALLQEDTASGMQPTDVPAGYFDSLPQLILQRIKQESADSNELETIAPVLATLSRQLPYKAPGGYFEQLDPLQAIQQTSLAKPIHKLKAGRMLRIAAAVLVLTAAFTIWRLAEKTTSQSSTATELMAVVADSSALHETLSTVTEDDLMGYFAERGVEEETESLSLFLQTTDIEKSLAGFSEEVLQAQLQETPLVKEEI